jgi:hypothetical protein
MYAGFIVLFIALVVAVQEGRHRLPVGYFIVLFVDPDVFGLLCFIV